MKNCLNHSTVITIKHIKHDSTHINSIFVYDSSGTQNLPLSVLLLHFPIFTSTVVEMLSDKFAIGVRYASIFFVKLACLVHYSNHSRTFCVVIVMIGIRIIDRIQSWSFSSFSVRFSWFIASLTTAFKATHQPTVCDNESYRRSVLLRFVCRRAFVSKREQIVPKIWSAPMYGWANDVLSRLSSNWITAPTAPFVVMIGINAENRAFVACEWVVVAIKVLVLLLQSYSVRFLLDSEMQAPKTIPLLPHRHLACICSACCSQGNYTNNLSTESH